MKYLVCAWSLDLSIGGTETYMIRMAKWAFSKGIRCCFALKAGTKIDDTWKNVILEDNINIEFFKFSLLKSVSISNNLKNILSTNDCTIIATDIYSYLRFLRYKTVYKLTNLKVLFYVLHPLVTRVSNSSYVNIFYKHLFMREIENSFLFMDEECISEASRFYNYKFNIEKIYRLGCFIDALDESYLTRRFNNKIFNILSISRMAFPFKGYQLGIIKSLTKISKVFSDFNVTIIGDGPDSHKLDSEIKKLPDELQKKIIRISKVPYKDLIEYFRTANVYIGMGTTLLDGAATGIPEIIATWNNCEPVSIGYFNDFWNNVGGDIKQSNMELESFSDLIIKIKSMNEKEYFEISKRTYNSYFENYNIELIMSDIMELKVKEQKMSLLLSFVDYFLYKYRELRYQKK